MSQGSRWTPDTVFALIREVDDLDGREFMRDPDVKRVIDSAWEALCSFEDLLRASTSADDAL
jgi:hypothetical protein